MMKRILLLSFLLLVYFQIAQPQSLPPDRQLNVQLRHRNFFKLAKIYKQVRSKLNFKT